MEMTPDENIKTDSAPDNARQSDLQLVDRIVKTIKADKHAHEKAFDRMRRDMFVAAHGYDDKEWAEDRYAANVIGRHIKHKTNSLYAKNPRAEARRRPTLDFEMWDEEQSTLMAAMQMVTEAQAAMQTAAVVQPMGLAAPPAPPIGGEMLGQAVALVEDAQRGVQRRTALEKFGKTLGLLYEHAMLDQNPLTFKDSMKALVRRACTTGVGYVKIDFQREYGLRPDSANKLADARARLDHLQRLMHEAAEGEIEADDAEMAELEASIAALESDQQAIVREGLVFDFPASTSVIPDRLCKSLVGFIGAGHLTIEYLYTAERVREVFGIDLEGKYTAYQPDGKRGDGYSAAVVDDEQPDLPILGEKKQNAGLVCVWEHFDKASGLVYYLADGFKGYLQEPDSPSVYVDDFWPVRALTFNAVESETELFPPSDVTLLRSMQTEINRSREGQREHRQAARPRWVYPDGAIDEQDAERISKIKPYEMLAIKIDPSQDMEKLLRAFPVPGVDPNLYETGPYFTDMQLVAGTSAAVLGGSSRSTATGDAIAADGTATSDESGVDDLDSFLTWTARSSGQVLIREMTPEHVREIAGPGAVWPGLGEFPQIAPEQLASEVYLEVEAGSSGRPNAAVEIRNWEKMLPFLLQIPGINPVWLARETVRRLDDRADLTAALASGMASVVSQNRGAQVAPGDAATDPVTQGANGGDRAPPPGGPTGSNAPIGDNHM